MWVLIWVGLAVAALLVFGLIGWSLWRKSIALLGEVAKAGDAVAEITARLEAETAGAPAASRDRRPAAEPELAVFADPRLLRRRS